jgi:hypothetical protein
MDLKRLLQCIDEPILRLSMGLESLKDGFECKLINSVSRPVVDVPQHQSDQKFCDGYPLNRISNIMSRQRKKFYKELDNGSFQIQFSRSGRTKVYHLSYGSTGFQALVRAS